MLPKICRSRDPLLVRRTIWVFYLTVVLLFAQGARLHVHVYNHDTATTDHAHQNQAHFEYDASETGHTDKVAEIDLSQQGLMKSPSLGLLLIVLFVAVIVIFSPRLLTRVLWRHNRRVPLASWPFSLRPPLRAPPLYFF